MKILRYNKLRFLAGYFVLLLMVSCNRDEGIKKKVEIIAEQSGESGYEYGLSAMTYLMSSGEDMDYSIGLVRSLIKDSRFFEARIALDQLEKIHGKSAVIYFLRAVCLRNELRFKEASAEIKLALELDNGSREYLREEENINADSASWELIRSLDNSIMLEGKSPELEYKRGKLLIMSGYYTEARADLDSALISTVYTDSVYRVYLDAFLYRAKYEQADSLIEARPSSFDLGMEGKDKDLYERLKAVIKEKSIFESGSYNQADIIRYVRSLVELKDFESGDRILVEGLKKYPDDVRLLYSRLILFIQWGQEKAAREVYNTLKDMGIPVDGKISSLFE